MLLRLATCFAVTALVACSSLKDDKDDKKDDDEGPLTTLTVTMPAEMPKSSSGTAVDRARLVITSAQADCSSDKQIAPFAAGGTLSSVVAQGCDYAVSFELGSGVSGAWLQTTYLSGTRQVLAAETQGQATLSLDIALAPTEKGKQAGFADTETVTKDQTSKGSAFLKACQDPKASQATKGQIQVLLKIAQTEDCADAEKALASSKELGAYDIDDLSLIAGFTGLTSLGLDGDLTDISAIATLVNLERLEISIGAGKTDIAVLQKLPRLKALHIHSLEQDQLATISAVQTLEELDVSYSEFTDPTPLAQLAKLRHLEIGGIFTTVDLSKLVLFPELEHLEISQDGFSDLSLLSGMTGLKHLSIHDGKINDLTPIAGLTELERLYLINHEITSVAPLANMTKLARLLLPDNQIIDVSPLAGLVNLVDLHLYDNQVTSVASLSGLTKLEVLALSGNPLTSQTCPVPSPEPSRPVCSFE